MTRGPGRRRTPFFRPGADAAADEEIAHHIAERADRLVAEGWDPEDARREAERRFGDAERWRREMTAHDTGTTTGRRGMRDVASGIVQDLRFGWRSALRRPGSTAVLVLTLGLGIGAGTAIFTVVDALLLRPLPYADPDRIVSIYHVRGQGISVPFMPPEHAEAWLDAAGFLADVAFSDRLSVARTDGTPETLGVLAASHDLDDLLGIRPWAGRLFTPDDADPGTRVALLTWKYWQRLGADPSAVGSTIELEGQPVTVVGVLPRDFKYPVVSLSDLWVPLASDYTALGRPVERPELVGRLPAGVGLEAAQERADAVAEGLAEGRPGPLGWQVQLGSLGASRADPSTRRALDMLAGAVALMLLVSLLNAANLLVVRARGRTRELAVRRALGAGRARVARQIVVESLLPGLMSGLVAVALAAGALAVIRGLLPRDVLIYQVYDPRLGLRVLAFTFALAAVAGTVVGLIPALHLVRRDGGTTLTSGARGGDGPAGTRLRNGLVVLELALSVILLAGAGLLVNSFVRLAHVDPGFRAEGLAYATLTLNATRYPGGQERRLFLDELERRVEALPGVEGAAVSMGVPPQGGGVTFADALQAEGGEPLAGERTIAFAFADRDFVEVVGARLLAGRALVAADRGEPVVLVDRELAADLFGSAQAAPGRRFRMDTDDDWKTVAGVIEDLKMYGTRDVYGPYVMIRPRSAEGDYEWVTVSVRGEGDAGALLAAVRAAVRDLDPDQPIEHLRTAERALRDTVAEERFLLVLMGALSATALALAAIGIYGVLAAVVVERRREMGIRMALGAGRGSIRRMVVGRGMALAGVGAALGVAGALAVTRFGSSLLFGVEPGDPTTLAAVVGVMLLAALLAALLPTVRATRVDPADVLRCE